jgi:ATP-dependent exoDNAse (exonuclease V) beta subunit
MGITTNAGRILFRESDHVYYHETLTSKGKVREKYRSVTTLLGMLKKKIDSDKIAEAYAEKHGIRAFDDIAKKQKMKLQEVLDLWGHLEINKENILKIWKEISEMACERGTKYHAKKEKESYELGAMPIIEEGEFKVGYDLKFLKNNVKYPELIIYHPFYKITGTADNIVFHDNKTFTILDFKTNRKGIDKPAFKGERLLTPVSHLEANKLNEYTLQLSIYAFVLEEWGYKCKDMIIQFVEDVEKDIIKEYPVPYLRTEAKAILEYFKQRNYKVA